MFPIKLFYFKIIHSAGDLSGPVTFKKIVIGVCFFEPDLNSMVPSKFQEAPFRTNITPLGLQKLSVALVPFICAATLGASSEILQGGLGDTLAGPPF